MPRGPSTHLCGMEAVTERRASEGQPGVLEARQARLSLYAARYRRRLDLFSGLPAPPDPPPDLIPWSEIRRIRRVRRWRYLRELSRRERGDLLATQGTPLPSPSGSP